MKRLMIGLCGGTGSGKTTLARKIYNSLGSENAVLIGMDSYYKANWDIPYEQRIKTNYDHPNAFDPELMVHHLNDLKEGKSILCPVYDFTQHQRRRNEYTRVESKSIIIIEGILLLAGMIFYILNMIRDALKKRNECPSEQSIPLYKALLFIISGLAAVIFGGNLVVNNASQIAVSFGVSQNFIGLTIVAIGTSLPELVTSIVATRKGDSGLALGNAIGSNIFNILFILGMSATISPLHILSESVIDCGILLISGILLFVFAFTKKSVSRMEGAVCALAYIGYTAYLFIR